MKRISIFGKPSTTPSEGGYGTKNTSPELEKVFEKHGLTFNRHNKSYEQELANLEEKMYQELKYPSNYQRIDETIQTLEGIKKALNTKFTKAPQGIKKDKRQIQFNCIKNLLLYIKLVYEIRKENGDINTFASLIEAGANINKPNKKKFTPLMIAALCGKSNIVEHLLNANADVDKPNHNGATPLFIAAQNGHVDVVKYLIDHGADVDKPNHNGATPLFIAAQTGDVNVVKYLIDHGAEIDKERNDGATPLFMAANQGDLEIVQLLLDNGAKVDHKNKQGNTPLMFAVSQGHLDIVQLLLEKEADVNQANEQGETPLFIAAEQGHVDVVKYLIDHEADKDKPNHNGATPLFIAAQKGHVNVVKCLIEKGADIRKANNNGVSLAWQLFSEFTTLTPEAQKKYKSILIKSIVIGTGEEFNNKDLTCPITNEPIFYDIDIPYVLGSDGSIYENKYLKKWLKINSTSPITREPVASIPITRDEFLQALADKGDQVALSLLQNQEKEG